jgi:hypothetical protein
MNTYMKDQRQPEIPPMEDPQLPDSYEPSPGEVPDSPQKEKKSTVE